MSPSLSTYKRYRKNGRCGRCGEDNDQPLYAACSRCYTPSLRTPGATPSELTSQLLYEAKCVRLTGEAVERYICAGVKRIKKRVQYAARREQQHGKGQPTRRPRHARA